MDKTKTYRDLIVWQKAMELDDTKLVLDEVMKMLNKLLRVLRTNS